MKDDTKTKKVPESQPLPFDQIKTKIILRYKIINMKNLIAINGYITSCAPVNK